MPHLETSEPNQTDSTVPVAARPAPAVSLFDVSTAARYAGGRTEGLGISAQITRVVIDSRTIEPGDLFVALPGSKTHGHDHVADALSRGAVAALVGPECAPLTNELAAKALIRVASPRRALGDLGSSHRRTLRCPVIGVTGSNGKSTTREMIAALLEPLGDVIQSEKSFNNDLGVPLTVLRANRDTAALVCEIGTSGPGEIAHLTSLARPDIGVVTNVSAAHLQGLGDEDGVAHEKAGLVRGLRQDGFAILNADDPRTARMARDTQANVVTYSLGDWRSTVWGAEARRTPRGIEFFLFGKGRMFLPVPGLHNVRNALAAASVALLQGLTAEQIRAQFRGVKLPSMRMEKRTFGGVTLLLDCYNANPASMRAGIDELATRPAAGRRVLVMGDMLELGPRSGEFHYAVGRHAAGKVDELWCVGPESRLAADGAIDAGMDPAHVRCSDSVEAAMASAVSEPLVLGRGDVALLKASRGMRMERLAEPLRKAHEAHGSSGAGAAPVSDAGRRVG